MTIDNLVTVIYNETGITLEQLGTVINDPNFANLMGWKEAIPDYIRTNWRMLDIEVRLSAFITAYRSTGI